MLLWCDVAEHGGSSPFDHGRSNGAANVVVSWRDIGHQAQCVERCPMAQAFLFIHIFLNLVHRNVQALNHDLHAVRPSSLSEFAQYLQFSKLSFIICDTASRNPSPRENETS